MVNLTLSVDEHLLQQARAVAVREQTSVNAVVREFLSRYVDARARHAAALDALDHLAAKNAGQSADAWTRESLHER